VVNYLSSRKKYCSPQQWQTRSVCANSRARAGALAVWIDAIIASLLDDNLKTVNFLSIQGPYCIVSSSLADEANKAKAFI
jgi:hypothetical protein